MWHKRSGPLSTLSVLSGIITVALLAAVAVLELVGKPVPTLLLAAACAAAAFTLWRAIAAKPKLSSPR
jgi:hypothetical protein